MKQDPHDRIFELSEQTGKSIEAILYTMLKNRFITIDNNVIVPTAYGYATGCFDSSGATTGNYYIDTNDGFITAIAYHDGILMKFRKNLSTNEVTADVDCLAVALGYANAHELLSHDDSLDTLNQCKKETGVWPVQTIVN
jgi:hypothetical protein